MRGKSLLLINNEVKTVDHRLSDAFPVIEPREKLANVPNPKAFNIYYFQLNSTTEIKIPSSGVVILEFNRGKTKTKIDIKLDDNYIPEFSFTPESAKTNTDWLK